MGRRGVGGGGAYRRADTPALAANAHLLRADSGFCREELMVWCEANRVDYLFGLAKNTRLVAEISAEMAAARAEVRATGRARKILCIGWSLS